MKIPDLIFKSDSTNLKDSQSQMEGKGKQNQTKINTELVKNIKKDHNKYWKEIFGVAAFSFGKYLSSVLSKNCRRV